MHYRRKTILSHFSCGERIKPARGGFNKAALVAWLLLLSLPIALIIKNSNRTLAASLEADFEIKSFSLVGVDGEVTTFDEEHASENIEDYAVIMKHNSPTTMNLVLDLHVSGGRTISAGDTVTIPTAIHVISAGTSKFDLVIDQFDNAPLYSGSTNIGTFGRGASSGIILTFNENAAGIASFNDLSLTLNNAVRSAAVGYERVGYITIAGQKFYFGIDDLALGSLVDDRTYTGLITNNNVLWETRIGSALTNEVSSSRGASGSPVALVVEQDCPGAIDHGPLMVVEARRIPKSLSAGSGASHRNASEVNRVEYFTEVAQRSNETYAQFKARVSADPLQYGFYKYDGGIKFVINYGRLGLDTPFESANNWAENAADEAIALGYYADADREALIEYYLDCFGDDSAIKQSPSSYFNFRAIYPAAVEDTTVATDTIIRYAGQEPVDRSASATLVGIFGDASNVQTRAAQIVVVDVYGGTALNGGSYKLQILGNEGYGDYTPNDGGSLIREVVDDGVLLFSNLGYGTYRVVEVSVPDGYDPTLSDGYDEVDEVAYSESFTISANDESGARVVMRNERTQDNPDDPDDPNGGNSGNSGNNGENGENGNNGNNGENGNNDDGNDENTNNDTGVGLAIDGVDNSVYAMIATDIFIIGLAVLCKNTRKN